MKKVWLIPLVMLNTVLEKLTNRIPTDVDLMQRNIILEAEREILRAENKKLREEFAAKRKAAGDRRPDRS